MSDLSTQVPLEKPTGSRFGRMAAMFSLISSVAVIFIFILIFLSPRFHSRIIFLSTNTLLLLSLLLIFGGIILGILAIALTKKHERTGVFGKALVGICINGLLFLLIAVAPILLALLFSNNYPTTPQGRLDKATKTLASASGEADKFYALNDAAKESFEVGKIEDAQKYSKTLLMLAPKFQGDWNYGNAIHDGNLVLGRIAVREGRTEEAKKCLLAAGKSPGSPQMNSFGPNMSLAKDLLEKSERDTVLQYFDLCRNFWKMDDGKLDDWSNEVREGKIPQFCANLVY